MAKSGYQRIKEYRLRQSSGEQLPTCKMCGRFIKGKLSVERGMCSYCYPKTEEGSKASKAAMERYYAKQRASTQQTLHGQED
ncbi:MAG: hypothetical protein DSM106950_15585 [Stigonema ocellatum SAG 48.90 = DSM 106950]|nr:hypothetical protein [Stigonema ocellatum SAG 48.90 = DSM 106950]